MKNRILILTSVVMLLVGGFLSPSAGASRTEEERIGIIQNIFLPGSLPRGNRSIRRFRARMARELQLTDQQRAEIRAIVAGERPTIKPLIRRLFESRQTVRSVAGRGQFDEAHVRAIAAQQAETVVELIVIRERIRSKVYDVLTPEQRLRAGQIRERLEARIRERLAQGDPGH